MRVFIEKRILDRETFQRLFDKMQGHEANRQEVRSLLDALSSDPALAQLFRELVAEAFVKHQPFTSADPFIETGNTANTTHGASQKEQEEDALNIRLQRQWEKIIVRTQNNSVKDLENTAALSEKPHDLTPVTSSTGISSMSSLSGSSTKKNTQTKWYRWAAVLLLLLGLSWGVSLYWQPSQSKRISQVAKQRSGPVVLMPGTDAAILTLDNGEELPLDSTTGRAIKQRDQLVARNADGQLDYQVARDGREKVHYNTLTTKKGNQYKLLLPDGSKVWLNAESAIRFPTSFADGSRDVALSGEAYFEVRHDSRKPFKVHVAGQVIEDLGTRFNVNAYEDESALKATLVEGAIRIQNQVIHPGEQAVIDAKGHMQVQPHADIAQVTGWKQGMFVFHQMDMKAILRQVARWYNVDIVYVGDFNQTFSGGISRNANAEEVLKILSYSDKVTFSINGRKITVKQRRL